MKRVILTEEDFKEVVKFISQLTIGFDGIELAASMKEALKRAQLEEEEEEIADEQEQHI